MNPQKILTPLMVNIVVDKSKDHAKQLSICFFTTTSMSSNPSESPMLDS